MYSQTTLFLDGNNDMPLPENKMNTVFQICNLKVKFGIYIKTEEKNHVINV